MVMKKQIAACKPASDVTPFHPHPSEANTALGPCKALKLVVDLVTFTIQTRHCQFSAHAVIAKNNWPELNCADER